MTKFTTFIATFLAFQTFVTPVFSETPAIEQQQQEYAQLKAVWEQEKVPSGLEQTPQREKSSRDSGHEGVALYIKNVNFDIVENIGFQVKELAVTLDPVNPGSPTAFDWVDDFVINIHHGEVTLSIEVIDALFNKHILDYEPRPLDQVSVTAEDQYLVTSTKLKLWNWFPGIWLPAKLGGNIIVEPQTNNLVYDLDDVRVVGIPLAGLLKLIRIKLTLLLEIDRPGAQLEAYSLALDHNTVFPPPAIGGTVEKSWLDEDGLHLSFNDNPDVSFSHPPIESDSYLWIQSGDAKLYGVVVTNGGVQVISDDDSSPLRFNLYEYREQVAKGILKMTEAGDIIATIPSYIGSWPRPPAQEEVKDDKQCFAFSEKCD